MRKLSWLISFGLAFGLGFLSRPLVGADNPARVTGIGGIFIKSRDPDALKVWYSRHLGLKMNEHGTVFHWKTVEGKPAQTQWSAMDAKTTYFEPSTSTFMINYRVANLESLIVSLRSEGVTVVDPMETYDYGKFVHILDPDGNKIELWEPASE